MSEDTTTYFITKNNGEDFQVTVPKTWKVTFGPAVVGEKRSVNSRIMPMALRFYETPTQQRAIFTDVISFRDTSIPIKIKKTVVKEEQGFTEYRGKRRATTFQAKTYEWIDPNKDEEQDQELLEDLSFINTENVD